MKETGENAATPATASIDPRLARALVRSLSRGTALPGGARLIHVGHEEWLAAQIELLTEMAEDGYPETKFVRGAYGAGKSHFLSVVQEMAREHGWITSHIECHFDHIEIDRFETLYPALVKKLAAGDTSSAEALDGAQSVEPIRAILDRWAQRQLTAVGLRSDARARPFDADTRLFAHSSRKLFRGAVPQSFARALSAYALATLAGDVELQSALCTWISAGSVACDIPNRYLHREARSIGRVVVQSDKGIQLRPISAGTVHDAMRGLLWLIRDTGYSGLVLCIDEVEELARLGSRKRQDRALQALREYVDHAGGDDSYKWLCMYLAATPEMFDNQEFFPRYDALASRIQSVSRNVNWRAPVIDLDKTPLGANQLQAMAAKIRDLYRIAHGDESVRLFTEQAMSDFVVEVTRTKVRMARPRLLCRIVIDELERARIAGASYSPSARIDTLVNSAAESLERGRDG